MDFYNLARKDLQALCKKNKIPANMTNVAMADALNALQDIKGIEDVQRAISPAKAEAPSPDLPRTFWRTSTCGKLTKELAISMENVPGEHTESSRRVTRSRIAATASNTRRIIEEPEKEDKKSGIPESPVTQFGPKRVIGTSVRRRINTCNREDEQKEERKDDKNSVNRVYTRRSSRRLLSEKKLSEDALSITKHQGKRETIKVKALSEEFEDAERKLKEGFERFGVADPDSKESAERRKVAEDGVPCDGITVLTSAFPTEVTAKFPATIESNEPPETDKEDGTICDPDLTGTQDESSRIVDPVCLNEVCGGGSKAFDVISGEDLAAEEHLGEICNPEAISNLVVSSGEVCIDILAPVQESIQPPPETGGVESEPSMEASDGKEFSSDNQKLEQEQPDHDSDAAVHAGPDSNGDLNIGLELSSAVSQDLQVKIEKLTKDLAEDQMLDSEKYSGNTDQIGDLKTSPIENPKLVRKELLSETDANAGNVASIQFSGDIPIVEETGNLVLNICIGNSVEKQNPLISDFNCQAKETTLYATEIPHAGKTPCEKSKLLSYEGVYCDGEVSGKFPATEEFYEPSGRGEICDPGLVGNQDKALGDIIAACIVDEVCGSFTDAVEESSLPPKTCSNLESKLANVDSIKEHLSCSFQLEYQNLEQIQSNPVSDANQADFDPQEAFDVISSSKDPVVEKHVEMCSPDASANLGLGLSNALNLILSDIAEDLPVEIENPTKDLAEDQMLDSENCSTNTDQIEDLQTAPTLDLSRECVQCCDDPNSSSPMENSKLVREELLSDTDANAGNAGATQFPIPIVEETENLVQEICIGNPVEKQNPLISECKCQGEESTTLHATEFPIEGDIPSEKKGTQIKSKLLNYDDKENNNNNEYNIRGLKLRMAERENESAECVDSKQMVELEDLSLRKLKKLVKEKIDKHTKVKSARRPALEPLSENCLLDK